MKDGDRVLIVQEIGWEAVLLPVLTAIWSVLTYTIPYLGMQVWQVLATIAYTIYSYVTAPSPNKPRNALDTSPTYSWEGMQMTVRQATPIPVVYGEHKISGHKTGGGK